MLGAREAALGSMNSPNPKKSWLDEAVLPENLQFDLEIDECGQSYTKPANT